MSKAGDALMGGPAGNAALARWADDAVLAASLLAVDPAGLGGACLRSPAQPARDQWLSLLRELLPRECALRRIPCSIADQRLLGGLDLTATLRASRPIAERGVLALCDGGVVVLSMAERVSARTAAYLAAALDHGEVHVPREGVSIRDAARIGLVALDEGMSEDEGLPAALLDRLAFLVDMEGGDGRTLLVAEHDREDVARARELLPRVEVPESVATALCATALALGGGSPRVDLLALRAARAAAALAGRRLVGEEDAVVAGRLVLAPRATRAPGAASATAIADAAPRDTAPRGVDEDADAAPRSTTAGRSPAGDPPRNGSDAGAAMQSDGAPQDGGSNDQPASREAGPMEQRVLQASWAALPGGLLTRLASGAMPHGGASSAGRAGEYRGTGSRGRPSGVRAGAPVGGARLNVIETLRAAAPWQRLRGAGVAGDTAGVVRITAADLRVTRYRQRAATLTLFAVDASGSAALARLAEAKGAAETLLAECYIRRDQVAVIAFRGRGAEILLPPTRSLVRAKRSLSALAGGGGTPLAAGIVACTESARRAMRRGETPTVVVLSDGRANVALDGTGGRERAHGDALRTAAAFRAAGIRALFVDTAARPSAYAREIAHAMLARYLPLPQADARALSVWVNHDSRAAG